MVAKWVKIAPVCAGVVFLIIFFGVPFSFVEGYEAVENVTQYKISAVGFSPVETGAELTENELKTVYYRTLSATVKNTSFHNAYFEVDCRFYLVENGVSKEVVGVDPTAAIQNDWLRSHPTYIASDNSYTFELTYSSYDLENATNVTENFRVKEAYRIISGTCTANKTLFQRLVGG